ncbi:MAG: LPXTG cell wall anchor domain-containing protein [Chloroflexi bacterium]|nr:LPXTG cell wall anchor domain-containing protein [Chloroflexota bacterium]
MSDNDENLYQDFEEEEAPEPKSRPPGNRTFLATIGILGVIFLLALGALAVYAFLILPQRSAERRELAAQINAQNTATSVAATQMALLAQQQLTPSPTSPSDVEPTPTPVIVFPTATVTATSAEGLLVGGMLERTQTVAALLTQAAGNSVVVTYYPTALPATGFADEVGLPGLLGMALLLIVIIFLVRRLRLSGNG